MDSSTKLSEEISKILVYFRQIQSKYEINRQKLSEYDKHTNDFNHALELDDLNYKERARLATKQRDNLIERRKCKDEMYEYQPLVDLLSSKDGLRFMNLLGETLGKIRKQEKAHEGRVYHKRVK